MQEHAASLVSFCKSYPMSMGATYCCAQPVGRKTGHSVSVNDGTPCPEGRQPLWQRSATDVQNTLSVYSIPATSEEVPSFTAFETVLNGYLCGFSVI